MRSKFWSDEQRAWWKNWEESDNVVSPPGERDGVAERLMLRELLRRVESDSGEPTGRRRASPHVAATRQDRSRTAAGTPREHSRRTAHGTHAGETEVLIPAGYVREVYDATFTLSPDKRRYVATNNNTPTMLPAPGLPFSLVFRAEPGAEDRICEWRRHTRRHRGGESRRRLLGPCKREPNLSVVGCVGADPDPPTMWAALQTLEEASSGVHPSGNIRCAIVSFTISLCAWIRCIIPTNEDEAVLRVCLCLHSTCLPAARELVTQPEHGHVVVVGAPHHHDRHLDRVDALHRHSMRLRVSSFSRCSIFGHVHARLESAATLADGVYRCAYSPEAGSTAMPQRRSWYSDAILKKHLAAVTQPQVADAIESILRERLLISGDRYGVVVFEWAAITSRRAVSRIAGP